MENDIIALLRLKHLTIEDIAFLCDCSKRTVCNINYKYKIRKVKKKLTINKKNVAITVDVDKIKKLLEDPYLSTAKIAKECKCSITTVNIYNRKFKIRNRAHKYTREEEEKVKELLKNSKLNMIEIAKQVGISKRQVTHINDEHKLRTRKPRGNETDKIRKLLKTKKSIKEISEICNRSTSHVYYVNKQFKIRPLVPRRCKQQ
ncbi:MAG: hypothetical protein KZY55_13860 [Paeniclostridium sp.]|nr:hypothetical protein [Paeniclostridium sp.]MBW4875138.1 hypothetical protein [Paeniclostridium sp.]